MALKNNYSNDRTGVSVVDAYYRVTHIKVANPSTDGLVILIGIYNSEADRNNNKVTIDTDSIQVSDFTTFSETALEASNNTLLKACYAYIKTLDTYTDATDA